MSKNTVKVPRELLVDLLGPIHREADNWYRQAQDNRDINCHDIANNCVRYGEERAAIANEVRRLLDLPPMEYR